MSLVTERVKTLPAMREIWVRSLGWEHPLEEDMASILAWMSGHVTSLLSLNLLLAVFCLSACARSALSLLQKIQLFQ